MRYLSENAHHCAVCLRKLHSSVGFEATERDGKLLGSYRQAGREDEAQWTEERLNEAAPGGGGR